MGKDVNPLIFACEGKVIAPPMKFEELGLDFKQVPFGFEEVKEVTLVNLANVEINFEIEIPDEGEKNTFIPEFVPKSIKPMDKAKIPVRFHPRREGEFAASLTVKVPNVAQDFATLPLKGVCQRPTVELSPSDNLNFEEVYLRKAKTKEIVLINTSNLKARYKAIEQEEASTHLAIYSVNPPEGEIKPRGRCEVTLSLEAQMRGPISVPLYLNVSSKPMNERIIIKAEVLGPHVTADAQIKEFKDVKVLSKVKDKVVIHNDSEIPANFTAFTREKNSVFKVDPRTGVLQPDEKKELNLVCSPDDAQVFDDVLYIDICDGTHCEVKLRAKATGTSICIPGYEPVQQEEGNQKLPVYYIDFGTHYINFEAVKTINVENRGRRRQPVRFERLTGPKGAKAKKEKEQKDVTASQIMNETRKQQKEEEDEEANHVFYIDPIEEEKGVSSVHLEPQHGFTLNCKARSKAVQKALVEGFRFLAGTEGTRKEEAIFIVYFRGNFILPQLTFSEPKLYFKYRWQGEHKREPIVHDLEIACESEDSSKGTSFRLNLPLPFRIKEPIEKMALMPGAKQKIQIEFDPSGTEDRFCRTINGNLEFVFDRDKGGAGKPNHFLPLEGELCYPNLEVSPTSLDFRCILLDTSKKEYLTLKNTKELPVKYHWEFFEEISDVILEEPEEEPKRRPKKAAHPNIPVNELFDILPISGVLEPGETETVEVTFHALTRNPKPAHARCVIEGGPEYVVTFKGEGAEIVEPVLEDKLEFGEVLYCEEAKNSFKIKNTGKVGFKYFVSLEKVSRPEMFKIEKQAGLILPDETEKIEVKLKPGIPEEIKEELLVYIGHLEPKKILVTAVGTFPFLIFATQRADKERFFKKVEEMERTLARSKPSQCLQSTEEIHKLLSKKPENLGRSQMSQMSTMLKPQLAEVEAEVDRQDLCRVMLAVIFACEKKRQQPQQQKQHAGMVLKTHPGDKKAKVDITVAKFVYDFGNVVGGQRKQSILFFNIGKVATTISAYVQEQKENDVIVKPKIDKIKLQPLEGTMITFNLQIIKKKSKPVVGRKSIPVFVEVKGGLRYEIDVEANVTTPELAFSHEVVNFGEVPCGQRKTISVRFENHKEVDCDWSYIFKEDVAAAAGRDKKGATPIFSLNPNEGKLAPGHKMNVEITFTPNKKDLFDLKVQPSVKNSQGRPNIIRLVGSGIVYSMKLDKTSLTLGPQLPYVDAKEYVPFKIINETNAAIEVYSLEFDKTYLKEEKMLMNYKKLDANRTVAKPVRQPGTEFWKDIEEEVERANRAKLRLERLTEIDTILGSTKAPEDEGRIEALKKEKEELEQAKLEDEEAEMAEPDKIRKVEEEKKLNVIIFGWDKQGNTAIANHLSEQHKRGIISISQVLQWNMQKNTQAAQNAQKYLAEKEKELHLLKEDMEKKKKKLKKGEPEPTVNEAEYKILPKELFVELIRNRISEEDCNAGTIFDSLESEHCRGIVDTVEAISDACGVQNIKVVMLEVPKEITEPEIKVTDTENKPQEEEELEKEEEKEEEEEKFKLRPLLEEEKEAYLDQYTKLGQKMTELEVKALASKQQTEGQRYGERLVTPIEIFPSDDILETVIKSIPKPEYPDPANMPLPPPKMEQLLSKPKELHQVPEPIPQFRLLTLKKKKATEPRDENQQNEEEPEYEEKTRWVLPVRDSQEIFVKFYSERTGEFKQNLHFGIVGGEKTVELALEGKCEYPMMSDKSKTIFALYERRGIRVAPLQEKRFDKSKGRFDFGPLLIGKEFEKRQQEKCKVNVAKFNFSNAGHFPVHVDFTLRSQSSEYSTEHKSPFYIEPQSLDIPYPSEEPYEVKVWAFPDKPIEYRDALVCTVKDNPKPVVLKMVCYGAQPEVKVEPEGILFERLLVGQQATKELKLTNESRIPVNWKLQGIEKLPKEIVSSQKDGMGTLKPLDSTTIQFKFSALEQKEYEYDFTLFVTDDETKELKQEPKAIKLKAKSYVISVAPRFESDKQELNFGAVRVGETAERKFFLKNNGLYDVDYRILLKTKEYRERFTISEMKGTLNASEEKAVSVSFKSKTGWSQNTTNENTGLVVQIMEGSTGKEREEIPIKLNVNAVYSQFSVTPVRGINFGPMQYGESKTMSFEIKNDGKFDFNYIIFDAKNDESRNAVKELRGKEGGEPDASIEKLKKPEKKEEKKTGKSKGKGGDTEGGLRIGQFTINPSSGDIAAGSSAIIKVTFEAEGAKFYETNLSIDVSGRNFAVSPEGLPYQLIGESCIPGINSEDVQAIFEEQTVVNTLDPSTNIQSLVNKSVFSIEENVFWFGTLVPSKDTKGQIEKFKITNPNKIPCSVKLSVKPRTSSKSEGFGFELSPEALKIPPHESQYVKVCFKPTNIMSYGGIFEALVENGDPKSRSGKLRFELRGEGVLPTVMMEKPSFIGEDGTPVLMFKKTRLGNVQRESIVLKNDGSLPATVQFDPIVSDVYSLASPNTVTIQPKSYQNFELVFEPKIVGEFKHMVNFVTVNNPYESQQVRVYAESYQEDVVFEDLPDNAEDELKIGDCIIDKPKKVQFTMVSKSDKHLRFEWLNYKKELRCYPRVGFLKPHASKTMVFVFRAKAPVKIQEDTIWCKFIEIQPEGKEVPEWDDIMTETRMVRPSELKLLMAKRAEQEAKIMEENEALSTQISAQKFASALVKMTKSPEKKKEVAKKDLAKGAELPSASLKIDETEDLTEEIEEPVKEPQVKLLEDSNKEVGLKCIATADYPKYECSVDKIYFKPTLMFQTRSYKFSVKNTSLISFDYYCKFTDAETGSIDAGPYSIIPRKGIIQAGCEESFIIKFSPIDAEDSFERLLVISIPSLNPAQKPLVLEVDGSSERPICHFELSPSKYREKKEKDMAPIDNKYNIIEFESLGTKVKNIKRFMVVNPTSQGYEFEWGQDEDKNKANTTKAFFRCLTPKGTILSGKKYEMAFEYVPESIGTHESYWEFRVLSEKVTQQFLIVGQVLEPLVLFETAKVDFGPLLVGGKNREIVQLRNQEHIPFAFNFDFKTLRAGEDTDSLSVTPTRGTVDPQSSVPIEITFAPRNEKAYNYNLLCKVKRKGRPLNINVKGVGYILKHEVYIENGKFPIYPKENTIEFGDFFINEKKTRTITIVNLGEFNFDFIWKRPASRYLTITPESGSVKKGSKVTVDLTYFPITPHKLLKYRCGLTIVSGPTYEFQMVGSARKPGVEFTFQKFDFGKCFVMRQPLSKTKVLEMKNNENTALSVDLMFEKKPHLDVQLNPGQVLLPHTEAGKEKIAVPIIFTPRDIAKYEETIMFDFNGIHKASVVITGEGIPLVLELTRPEDQFLDFGVLKVGGDQTRTAALVNRSKKPVVFKIFPDSEVEFQKCCLSLSVNSKMEYTLKPNETLPIEVRFQPTARMPAFKHELLFQIKDNETRRLCTVTGVSHGIEIKFIEDTIDFGSVVKDSRLTKQLQIANFGDIDAKFFWDTKTIPKHFTIVPETGHIPPHEENYFEVVFHPEVINEETMRYEKILCKIEGADALSATFVGKCVDQSKENTKDMYFTTIVRTATTSNVIISNPTTNNWTIKPTISTKVDLCKDYFKGKNVLEIPAKGSGTYEVTYLPLTMTKEKPDPSDPSAKPTILYHEASLFFPLPDGSALLYKLFGQSSPPKALSTIKETAVAKKPKFISIPVKNWLNEVQRFAVSWKMSEKSDPAIFIRGANTFDVGSGSTKDYKLNFLAYKKGTCTFTLTFKNESSEEYIFYDLEIDISPPETLAELDLVSVVRESVTKVITIENPLSTPVTINKSQFIIDNDYVFITPETVTISPQREGAIEINFRPLVVESKKATLTLENSDLGTFSYKLMLKGLKSTTQRAMHFKASLGAELVQGFRFTHYVKNSTTYTVKIERISEAGAHGGPANDFKAEQAMIATPAADPNNGTELSLNVKFEPNNIGETRAILIITNPDGVEYTCLLYGHGTAPQPQPITKVPHGKTSAIDFKNPFSEKCEFTIRFDNPCFSLANKLPGPIEAGKSVQLQVRFDHNETRASTGRMLISTKGLPAWVYYLHGEKQLITYFQPFIYLFVTTLNYSIRDIQYYYKEIYINVTQRDLLKYPVVLLTLPPFL
eukprot:TRINITY_DN386_c0_g1_i3.p1 TRINITY_DN386_c0_g1~~TRINITY_DN386_c0_g1_i3.p1  ORF type:complete len:4093 (+),score=589.86 TRINITY_DN386_c0_g1_i3:873-13151(+)